MELTIIDSTGAQSPRSVLEGDQYPDLERGQTLRETRLSQLSQNGADSQRSYVELIGISTPENEEDHLSDITKEKIKLLFNKLLDSDKKTDSVTLLIVDMGEYTRKLPKHKLSKSQNRLEEYILQIYAQKVLSETNSSEAVNSTKKFTVIMMNSSIQFKNYPRLDAAHCVISKSLGEQLNRRSIWLIPQFKRKLSKELNALAHLSKNGIQIYTLQSHAEIPTRIQNLLKDNKEYTINNMRAENRLSITAAVNMESQTQPIQERIAQLTQLITQKQKKLVGNQVIKALQTRIDKNKDNPRTTTLYQQILKIADKLFKMVNYTATEELDALNRELALLKQELESLSAEGRTLEETNAEAESSRCSSAQATIAVIALLCFTFLVRTSLKY